MTVRSNRLRIGLKDIFQSFGRLGLFSFGGPAAHIALMRKEFVEQKKWLKEEEFLDYLSATNFIPGPNSTELAMHIGHHVAGGPGLIVAGLSFILPAASLVTLLAWLYLSYGYLPSAQAAMSGIKPAILAILAQAIWGMARTSLKTTQQKLLAILAFVANSLLFGELITIAAAGFLAFLLNRPRKIHSVSFWSWSMAATTASTAVFSQTKLFLFFLKVGSVLFGSGYVLLAYLRTDLVEKLHWLTEGQLLDAVAVGQFTPGPVFTTATFIGYVLAATFGAVLATVGSFLPAVVIVFLSAPLLGKLRQSQALASALTGVHAASIAVMAVTGLFLAKSILTHAFPLVLSLLALTALSKTRLNSAWIVLGGALLGILGANFI